MQNNFQTHFDNLMRSVGDSYPEATEWFFPQLSTLIEKYGEETALEYAKNDPSPAYISSLLMKAGLKEIDEPLLLKYLEGNTEDEAYDAAFCLAMYGNQTGFEALYEFASQKHRLSQNTHPKADILPDLKFMDDPRARDLEVFIANNYPDIESH